MGSAANRGAPEFPQMPWLHRGVPGCVFLSGTQTCRRSAQRIPSSGSDGSSEEFRTVSRSRRRWYRDRWIPCMSSRATPSRIPWVIVLALAHNYERLREVPSDENNGVGVCDVGDQYARGTRSSYALANWIRSQGYQCGPYPGPNAGAFLLIPPAIAAGLGELGKHGSLISPRFGSGVRLAGVTTDMPLVPTAASPFRRR